jgi:hypothetical protein
MPESTLLGNERIESPNSLARERSSERSRSFPWLPT